MPIEYLNRRQFIIAIGCAGATAIAVPVEGGDESRVLYNVNYQTAIGLGDEPATVVDRFGRNRMTRMSRSLLTRPGVEAHVMSTEDHVHNLSNVQARDSATNVAVLLFEWNSPVGSHETQFLHSAVPRHTDAYLYTGNRDVCLPHPSSRRILEADIREHPQHQISLH